MKTLRVRTSYLWWLVSVVAVLVQVAHASDVLGELELVGTSRTEKLAGVWIDGQYVGYLGELKGHKKLLLLPGEHQLVVRHGGYQEFARKLIVEPGQKQTVHVQLARDTEARYPDVTAEIKMQVKPSRAAVFIDGIFAGHIDEFDGPGQALLVAPGKRRIKIALPGYQPFESEVELRPNQKFVLKTELSKGSILQATPPIQGKTPAAVSQK
jgi:hypothetical protein